MSMHLARWGKDCSVGRWADGQLAGRQQAPAKKAALLFSAVLLFRPPPPPAYAAKDAPKTAAAQSGGMTNFASSLEDDIFMSSNRVADR
ncbi:hypothetical protein CEXT_152311 [Caerostris extrusa]|uniref:Uncharacterized protein n=1 Tax=Caerostris extrusa TaxID=172846 RepID=A0AAV4UWI8_CAEEX|nr:hypothetical protein CEXT_152311 [Caerostris extrusa]